MSGWHKRKASEQLDDVLQGRVNLLEAQPGIQSWASLYIHKGACYVLDGGTREERRERLQAAPEALRPFIEEAAMRIWERRK